MKRLNVFELYTNGEMLSDEVRGKFIKLARQAVAQGGLVIIVRSLFQSKGVINLTVIFKNLKFLFDTLKDARRDLKKKKKVKVAKRLVVDLFIDDLEEGRICLAAINNILPSFCYLQFNVPVKVVTGEQENHPLSYYAAKEKKEIFKKLRKAMTVKISLRWLPFFKWRKRLSVDKFVIYDMEGFETTQEGLLNKYPCLFLNHQGILFDV